MGRTRVADLPMPYQKNILKLTKVQTRGTILCDAEMQDMLACLAKSDGDPTPCADFEAALHTCMDGTGRQQLRSVRNTKMMMRSQLVTSFTRKLLLKR